jgi:hypothetical protein
MMKPDTEKFAPEPRKKWKRKNYNLKKLEGGSPRERAEIETTRDLSKPTEQLVCDFHDLAEEVIDPNSEKSININWFLLQAQKRMVSLMGRVALEHRRNSILLIWLTVVLVIMTLVLVWLTIVLVKHGG